MRSYTTFKLLGDNGGTIQAGTYFVLAALDGLGWVDAYYHRGCPPTTTRVVPFLSLILYCFRAQTTHLTNYTNETKLYWFGALVTKLEESVLFGFGNHN